MLRLHLNVEDNAEAVAARTLAERALHEYPELESSSDILVDIFSSVQCYGQKTQDVDLLIFYADYRTDATLFSSRDGKKIHSFLTTVEVKSHPPESVQFRGNQCVVEYREGLHDVSNQSEKQKYSVREYLGRNAGTRKPPWVSNLIWLTKVPSKSLPQQENNILGADASWQDVLDKMAKLSGGYTPNEVRTFPDRDRLFSMVNVFLARIEPSKLDRKRLEAISRRVLDRTQQQYAEKLGQQLLVYRGRGGTGKTIRLLRTAYQAYDEYGLRVLLLTYNKALVADIRRLLCLLGTSSRTGERSLAINTIHSFMYEWLVKLGVMNHGAKDFLVRYEEYKLEALRLLRAGALTTADIARAQTQSSQSLAWDLILVDESQDWPGSERDLLYRIYGSGKIVITDGVDQLVRGVAKIDWREKLGPNDSQIVTLRKSLRLKASLCETVGHFAEQLEIPNWNLDPEPEAHGGKVLIVEGDPLKKEFITDLLTTATADGNKPIDVLFCVPSNWVSREGPRRESRAAREFVRWGLDVWDGVDAENREDFPTSLEQLRVVQYESCRGLEGWVVVNFCFDEFFEQKRATAEFSDDQRQELFFDEESAALDYAKRWLMIPLTRAIDTLVIHLADPDSFVGKLCRSLHEKFPDEIEWVRLGSADEHGDPRRGNRPPGRSSRVDG